MLQHPPTSGVGTSLEVQSLILFSYAQQFSVQTGVCWLVPDIASSVGAFFTPSWRSWVRGKTG